MEDLNPRQLQRLLQINQMIISTATTRVLDGQPSNSIRLLTIQPDTGDLIDCTFTFAHFDAQPKYKALSYM
jgi:hypothetical protein